VPSCQRQRWSDLAGLAAVRDDLGYRVRDVGEREVAVTHAVRDRVTLRDDLVV
jgi:hypothetical protein